jgi:hypothetical protein
MQQTGMRLFKIMSVIFKRDDLQTAPRRVDIILSNEALSHRENIRPAGRQIKPKAGPTPDHSPLFFS